MPAYNKDVIELIKKAIGDRSQKDFAAEADISVYNLNRMLNEKYTTAIPRRSTLQKIADASQGRVSREELLEACGYGTKEDEKGPVYTDAEAERLKRKSLAEAVEVCEGIGKFAGTAQKYKSLNDFMDSVFVLYSTTDDISLKVISDEEYTGTGHKGAERMIHCKFRFSRNFSIHESVVYFTLFCCRTENGGYIVSDAVFNLQDLVDLNHPEIHSYIFQIGQIDDINYGDFPIAWEYRLLQSPEERLLKALFGKID